jgi:lipid-binding SYLF domain-containing protein
MLIMNQQGMQQLLASKFKIGADVSGAAGPVGRQASANTDWKLRSQVLTYSRSRGAFAGITLNGASIKQDDDSTRALYGKQESFTAILDGEVPVPAGGEAFVKQVAEAQKQAREPQNENASAGTSGGATGAVSTPNTPSKDNGNAGAVGTNTNQK